MVDAGLFPDTALLLAVEDTDILGRLLPPKLDKWQQKRMRKIEKGVRKKERQARKKVNWCISLTSQK